MKSPCKEDPKLQEIIFENLFRADGKQKFNGHDTDSAFIMCILKDQIQFLENEFEKEEAVKDFQSTQVTLNNKEFIKQKSNIKFDVNHSSDSNLNIFLSVTSSRNDNKGSDKLGQDPGKILENIGFNF